MNKKEILLKYKKKIKQLTKLNKLYFDKNQSSVSDEEYDILKKEIFSLEKKYGFLKSKNSPSEIVGYKPSKIFSKFQHKVPMLSLSNAFLEEDLYNFEKKIGSFFFNILKKNDIFSCNV